MANADRPHGFNPYSALLRCRPYKVDSSNTPAFFIGDVVDMEGDGNVNVSATSSIVKIGAALNLLAVSTASSDSNPLMVADHPSQLYEAQDDAATTSARTDLGNSVDHVAGTGNATTKLSGHELGLGTLSTSNGGFVLLELVPRIDNAFGANADMVCALNVGEGLLTVAGGI